MEDIEEDPKPQCEDCDLELEYQGQECGCSRCAYCDRKVCICARIEEDGY